MLCSDAVKFGVVWMQCNAMLSDVMSRDVTLHDVMCCAVMQQL